MRVRTVISGIFAGILCLVVLRFQFYSIELPRVVPGWPVAPQTANLPAWIATAIQVFCGITLFSFGWVAARWNWGENWQASLQSGAGVGLLAGSIIFDFVGVPWYSLEGQSQILMNSYTPVSQTEGTRIVIESVMQTGLLLYGNFLLVVLVCTVVGGLGGLVSALLTRQDFWGKDPRRPADWLFHLNVYLLAILGFLNLIVSIAVLRLLWEKTLNSVTQLDKQYDVKWTLSNSAEMFALLGYLVGLIFVLLPVGITWGWIIRSWYLRKKSSLLAALWILGTIGGCAWLLSGPIRHGSMFSSIEAVTLGLIFLIGLVVGLTSRERSDGFPYRFSDWVGYSLSFGILGGTQIVMGVVAYAVALSMIAIVNIPHLVRAEEMEKTPVNQVVALFDLQSSISINMMIAILVIGLILAGLVALIRNIFGMKSVLPVQE